MNGHEIPLVFDCEGSRLIGILTQAEHPAETGVVIVVGGPQYRAGSHRQFTLLARQLAEQGIASLRFDYRGMGDSEGGMRNFEVIDADIKAAIDTITTQTPSIKQVVLWGLCDAASAALYYGHTDPRVKGMILLNPWVHTEAGAASARLKHYYLNRLLSKAFWAKLFSGKLRLVESIGDLTKSARRVSTDNAACPEPTGDPRHGSHGYIDRLFVGLRKFKGMVLFILSGQDLAAQEFMGLTAGDKKWKQAISSPKMRTKLLVDANHTFSNRAWRNQVGDWTSYWLTQPYSNIQTKDKP